MSAESVFGRILTSLSVLLAGIAANAAELPHLQAGAQELKELNDRAIAVNLEQEAAKARLHQVTVETNAVLAQIRAGMTKNRNAIRGVYGTQSKKLEEFGMRANFGRRPKNPAPAANPVEPQS